MSAYIIQAGCLDVTNDLPTFGGIQLVSQQDTVCCIIIVPGAVTVLITHTEWTKLPVLFT
jgi:hypothetical protein